MEMDEEDFRIKVRPSPPPKGRAPRPPPLLAVVRRAVLQETEDLVLRHKVARQVSATEADVGVCFGLLEKEGVLELRPVPKDEVFRIGNSWVKWDGKGWAVHEFARLSLGIRKDPRQTPSKREIDRHSRKNPMEYVEWDGRAHYVIRGTAFLRAAKKAGLPADPRSPWACACGTSNKYDSKNCGMCYKSRIEPASRSYPDAGKVRICERCGGQMEMRRKKGSKLHPDHGLRNCNLHVVIGVMDE